MSKWNPLNFVLQERIRALKRDLKDANDKLDVALVTAEVRGERIAHLEKQRTDHQKTIALLRKENADFVAELQRKYDECLRLKGEARGLRDRILSLMSSKRDIHRKNIELEKILKEKTDVGS